MKEDFQVTRLQDQDLAAWRIGIGHDPDKNRCVVNLGNQIVLFFTADQAEGLAQNFLEVARVIRQRDLKKTEEPPVHSPLPEIGKKKVEESLDRAYNPGVGDRGVPRVPKKEP